MDCRFPESDVAPVAIRFAGIDNETSVRKHSRRRVPARISHLRQPSMTCRRIKDSRNGKANVVRVPSDHEDAAVRHLFVSVAKRIRGCRHPVSGIGCRVPDYSGGSARCPSDIKILPFGNSTELTITIGRGVVPDHIPDCVGLPGWHWRRA